MATDATDTKAAQTARAARFRVFAKLSRSGKTWCYEVRDSLGIYGPYRIWDHDQDRAVASAGFCAAALEACEKKGGVSE